MAGGLYSSQRCGVCGGLLKNNNKNALSCLVHPDQKATSIRVKFQGVHRRFRSYSEAERFLVGLRYKSDEGTFDAKDYKKENPMGFGTLVRQYLAVKEPDVKPKSYATIRNTLERAQDFLGGRNIKTVGYAEIEDFLNTQRHLSDKTRANMRSCLHAFFVWLKRRRIISEVPELPAVTFQMGFRKTVDRETQMAILEEIRRLTMNTNPKIHLAIKMLSTYISIRPGELIRVKEEHLDLKNRILFIPDPKEKRPKYIPLLDEDVEAIRSFTRGMPNMPFFRHTGSTRGTPENHPFSKNILYGWWKRACKKLGVEGVDLYGGTKHSTARAMRFQFSPEQIKRASMHSTNAAFDRYFTMELDDIRAIYAGTPLAPKSATSEKGKLLKFKE
ncbi:MAG TPA: site-specific integrase [Syntrophales bacterium]|nr:site-specific integrase [Syntrophales bacterium]HOX95019.1 site-specific integrase [Syntrophales bacterium]HPI56872.1 site-specific integrase [Syntrophales bacterium]HPN23458.1 site-specific integrase [Syntrophales bacterium]HQM28017.1 site-specific integrase [Syntrophales bacterium]